MSDAKNRCHAEETAACCCVDVGTVLDNQNCTASFEKNFLNQQEAEKNVNTANRKSAVS